MTADPVAIARDLLRCRSVTPAEGGALKFLEATLKAAGFTVHRMTFKEPGADDVENLYACIGTASPHLTFAGHTDVVPPGDEKAWKHPPFAGEVDGTELYGRGAVDMKGGIACAVAAVLDHLAANGGNVAEVNSVASFFVSRVDAKVDATIDRRLSEESDVDLLGRLNALRGTIGIANSKIAFEQFRLLHSSTRWDRLANAGAAPQRCLWASTSVKDPRYADTMYVDNLIGPDTVDTMPEATLEALADHGEVRASLTTGLTEAHAQVDELERCGISLNRVTDELEHEGIAAFGRSYQELRDALVRASAG